MTKVNKSDKQWRDQLTDEQYHISREKGTELPFSGKYWDCFDDGSYRCVCCSQLIFKSTSKFVSDCGWPSFSEAEPSSVETQQDISLPGEPRIEVLCAHCGSHLGHVFNDGPRENGLRFCINSAVLDLEKDKPKDGK
ncbi:MAG: peptide-methionine (R)-S-oxide reductase MsrB [Coxiellaceae bacterium]|nr:peptide-methionine (R)-S-oxide reductase MsrB [Coxiellaceae bacterium]